MKNIDTSVDGLIPRENCDNREDFDSYRILFGKNCVPYFSNVFFYSSPLTSVSLPYDSEGDDGKGGIPPGNGEDWESDPVDVPLEEDPLRN